MNRIASILLCACLCAITGLAAEQRVVFVAPFENMTGDERYDAAAGGMAELLGLLLAEQENITVVERQRFDAIVKEHKLSLAKLTGLKHSVQVGRLLKADTIVLGRLYKGKDKDTLLAAGTAIEFKTARVRAKDSVSCRPANLLEDSLQLAIKIATQLELPLPEIDLEDIDKSPAAALHFGQGISLYYTGNMDEAIMQFMRTVDLDPAYTEAYYWSGLCYSRLEEYPNAAVQLAKYLDKAPQGRYAAAAQATLAECRKHPAKPLLPGILPEKEQNKP